MNKRLSLSALLALGASLVLPGMALAQGQGVNAIKSELDVTWVMIGCVLVLLMQAGFLLLEIGFSRQKNVGAGVAKIMVNLSIATLAWWSVGFGISSLTGNDVFGTDGFFFHNGQTIGTGADAYLVGGTDTALMLFGMLFCAVSLAIVWGTTLERIKFAAYVIYATVFAAVIYPLVAHSVYGGGFLSDIGGKPVMDFAGSSVVHLDRRGRRARGAAAARSEARQVRLRRHAAGDPRALDAPRRPRRRSSVGRLVRLQRRFDVRHHGQLLRRGGAQHPAGRCGRCGRGSWGHLGSRPGRSTSAWPATAQSPAWLRSRRRPATSSSGRRRSSARLRE